MGSQNQAPVMLGRNLLLLLPGVAISQYKPIKVGEIVNNLLFPQSELVGGLERVIDGFHALDDKNLSCGKRQVCEAMSLGVAIERSDGSLDFEKGFLRQFVDGAGEVVFDIVKPFLEAVGLGRVARREGSFTSFLVDMIDSAIIGITRVLAGRRFSRQIEAVSPVASLVEPASAILRAIPVSYYGNILDLAVDITGMANRESGMYGIMRSGGLGYFYGGGDDSVCKSLQSNLLGDDAFCDNDGANYPLAMLNPINQHKLGKTVRIGGNEINPLMDRNLNLHPMETASFEWTDLFEPTKMLCKVDDYLKAVNGHVDFTEDPTELDPVVDETFGDIFEVRMDEDVVDFEDLDTEDQNMINAMMRFKKDAKKVLMKDASPTEEKPTSGEKFVSYCKEENRKELEKMLKKKNITVVTDDDNDEEGSGDVETQTVISVRKEKSDDQLDKSLYNLEMIARLGDHSLLSEKMEVEDGAEMSAVQSLVSTFNVAANGRIERVVKIDSKKGVPTLLIQFDSTEYRDAVLKSSRTPDARSSTRARLRRPKVKDLKHVASLLANH